MNINYFVNKLTNQYISGYIQSKGNIGIKLHKTKNKLSLKPYFNIIDINNNQNKELLLQIKIYFNNIGYISISKKDKKIKYEINSIEQLSNIIIPFLLKNDLKSYKHNKVIILESILKILNLKLHLNNNNILLSLIILSKPLLNNNLRYLNKQQQIIVNNNIYDNSIINYINELHLKLNNYNPTNLNKDYLNGLFYGSSKLINNKFNIIQDINEIILITNIKKYYNNIGIIKTINNTKIK